MVGNIDGNGGEGSTSIPRPSPLSPQPSSIQPTHDPLPGHFATGGEISTSHPPSKPPLSPLHPQSSSISASHDSPSVHLGTGGEDSSSHPPSQPPLSPIAPELSSITANHDTPPVHFGTGGEGSTSHSPSKPPQSLLPQQPSSITANHDTPAVHFGQISRRRSPRLLDCNNGGTDSSFDINRMPKKKKPRITESSSSSFPSSVSFLIGDPVPDEVARRKWPWRYDCQEPKSNGPFPKTNNNDDDEDKLVLNVKCHYLQAKIETNVFDLGDYATVKGEEGGHDHVGKILEFFKTNNNEDFFRIQWFFRAEDTVIKDEASSHDKKRLFYSTLMNDNPLDCIVSKVKVLKLPPSVCSKPPCDYYYDMKYNIDYSTFSTIKDDVESDTCCMSTSPNKEEIHSNGSKINVNGTIITNLKPKKLELTLLDMYSGCGGMSTGLCFGAKASGVDLKTKWAVDANTDACESLRQNHPKTQIRNEAAEDFLDLIKEWDKLCKKHLVKEEKNQDQDSLPADSADDVSIPSKPDRNVAEDEYEVEKIVDICYSDLGGKKRGIKFKVRWAGYGPSDDTWEPIQELSKCEDKIHEFVKKGTRANILPRPGDVGIICGGPPCQGISGYNRHRNFESPLEDERNYQIVVFMEIINFLNPKYVLMENVADILRFANGRLARYAVSCLVKNYYQTRLGIMAAGCYGLPQFRLRVFLWGARADVNLPPFPLPTHDAVLKYGPPTGFERNVVAYDKGQERDLEECVLLKDAISDLPPVSNSEIREEMTYKSDPETEFQKYIRATKSEMLGTPCGSSCVKNPVLYDHRPVQLNEDDYLRVCRIPKRKGANIKDLPGIIVDDDYTVTRIPEAELMPSGKHWVPEYAMNLYERKNPKSFARLWWDETVSTVFCLPNFRVEAVLHPEQDRVLTIRENARLQGFPDFYTLCGSVNQRYRQVGNAVAVPVGRALGYTLGSAFQKLTGDEPLTTLPPKFSHSTTIQLLQPPPSATTVSL